MTSLDLQTWLSLISTIAIVLALVFAGVQVREAIQARRDQAAVALLQSAQGDTWTRAMNSLAQLPADASACGPAIRPRLRPPPCHRIMQVRTTMNSPSTAKETGSMKNLALVAVLLSVVSLPAFAQSKFIKEANTKLTVTEATAPAPVAEGTQAAEGAATAEATDEAATEAPATDEAATAVDAATGEPATDAAAEPEKTEAKE